jgi:hypothetical protein
MKDDNGEIKQVLALYVNCNICPVFILPSLKHPPSLCPFSTKGPKTGRANLNLTDISDSHSIIKIKDTGQKREIKVGKMLKLNKILIVKFQKIQVLLKSV